MEIHHFCPRCGAPDVKIDSIPGLDGSYKAACPVCSWSGTGSETLGSVTSAKLWDTDRVLNFLLTNSLRNVGAVVQSLEVIGLLPPMLSAPTDQVPADKLAKHNQLVAAIREDVLRASLEAFVVTLISSSEAANKTYCEGMGTRMPRIFTELPKELTNSNDPSTTS